MVFVNRDPSLSRKKALLTLNEISDDTGGSAIEQLPSACNDVLEARDGPLKQRM